MLLINNKILLSSAIFEPHIFKVNELPFIFHQHITHTQGYYNTHENIEFLNIVKGTAKLRYGSEIISMCEGQLITINSHIPHQVFDGKELIYECLIIDKIFSNENGISLEDLHFTPTVVSPKAIELFEHITKEYASTDGFRTAAIRAAVLDFLIFMCRNYSTVQKSDTPAESDTYKRIQVAINYIKDNIDKKITVDDIAAHVRISKYHFLRQFKKVTGSTAVIYINQLRCEYAKQIFRTSDLPIKEVADMCGFDNCSYFAKIFKQYNGITPRQFVLEVKEGKI